MVKWKGHDSIRAEIFKAAGPNALEAFHDVLQSIIMEQRGNAWRLSQCSHCCSLQQQGEQVQLWKLQGHLTSFCSGNDLYSHSPEPTDHGNWKRSPRGAVWLQTRVQHRGHDFVIRQVQEKCIEQSKAFFSVFINLTKVFNTVNREALWMVLERYGCPKKFVRLIQLLHDGMKGQLATSQLPLPSQME